MLLSIHNRPTDTNKGRRLTRRLAIHVAGCVLTLICILTFSTSCSKKSTKSATSQCIDSIFPANCNIDSLKNYISHLNIKQDKVCLIASYEKLGNIYKKNNRFAEAIVTHQKGLKICKEIADTLGTVEFLNYLGESCRRIGEYNQASYYYYQSFSYSKAYSKRDEREMLERRVKSLNGIGDIFIKQKNWQMADSTFNQALNCEEILHNKAGQATCYANLGYVFESLNEIDSAWAYYRKSMMHSVEAQSEPRMSACHLHFGELYEKGGQWDKALREYLWANDLLTKNNDKWNLTKAYIAIARVYVYLNEGNNMHHYLKLAKASAKEIGSVQYISDIYQIYYLWYAQKGDNKRALENYILSNTYADSVMNLVKLNQMFNTRIKFMQGSHQSEIQSLTSNYTQEIDKRQMSLHIFIFITTIVTIIIGILLYMLHTRRKMNAVMQGMERMRSDFFTNVTHEFRTPLSVILGLSEQLENKSAIAQEELQKMGKIITYQGNQLLALVNQLLDISKIQSSLGNPKWSRGNIITFIDMLVENFQEIVRGKHHELVFLSKEKVVEMDFITEYMDKILKNLLSNAFKFTPEYGKIYITAATKKEHLIIYVADTGQGISNEDRPHIFDPFYQGTNQSFSVGSGIGLSLVHQLVTAMGGTIEVKSSVNEGTVFILKFPLKRKFANQEEYDKYSTSVHKNKQNVATQSQNLPEGQKVHESTPLVLIIEDNADVAYFIGSQLQNKYTLKYARNGKTGIEIAEDLIPDLIITDIVMPELNGYDVCHTIRASQHLNHIPIIIISVLNTEEERIKGLEAGADVYLCKPFNVNELNERIEYLLGQRRILRQKYSTAQGEKGNSNITEADQQFLNKLTDITYSIMKAGNFTVEDIASKMFMTRQQLNRRIHAVTGENTVTYLMHIRLSKAKTLLDSPKEYLIGEIAMECGFDDVAYFSRIFKKTYNITPTQYRKRVKD